MTGKQSELILPSDTPMPCLPDKFNNFYIDKISKIRSALDAFSDFSSCEHTVFTGDELCSLQSVSTDDVTKIISNSKKSFCELDLLPEVLFFDCIDIVLPSITTIFNQALSTGIFPSDFKESIVIPLLKKPSLDPNVLKNYRPVSNLSFVSKLLERIIFNQVICHLGKHNLVEKFQSAYKACHSTETALLRVVNDLLCFVDDGKISVLTMLDLSAAFDTIDHDILLSRISSTFGIRDKALKLIETYLLDRKQKIKLNNFYSQDLPLLFGVPQGSVLGPLLFTMYIYPICDVIDKNISNFHIYADDTQLYNCYKPNQIDSAILDISEGTRDINDWMKKNKLKMNADKTEIMLCGSFQKLNNVCIDSIEIDDDSIDVSNSVRNLGFFLDKNLNMSVHVTNLRKSCYYEIRKISHIRPFISEKCTIQLVVSLVLSKLDYCNCLLYGMSENNFHKLQLIQNHAARLIKKAPKRSSATDILIDLHWLPVKQRVEYKIALTVFKCLNVNDFPLYLKELITPYQPTRTLRSGNQFLLSKPFKKLETFGKKSFHYAAPEVWNSLPLELRSCCTLSIFKKHLKTHFFKIAYSI